MNESLGKWAKNVFTKFGKKSVEKEFLKTFNSFRKKYKLNRISEDKPNYFGKIEDGYYSFKIIKAKRAVVAA